MHRIKGGVTTNDLFMFNKSHYLVRIVVLARDRFGDFVSDQVVAPVRESSAMALGHLVKLMYDPGQVLGMNLDFLKIRFCQFYQ